jgi:flavin-dependent dehydrogenase
MATNERSVVVRGSGVAALTCARLLDIQGWSVRLEQGAPARRLHLLLGEATAGLLAALWNDPLLLAGAHPVRERAVSWGSASGADTVPAPGVAIGANELVRRLAARLRLPSAAPDAAALIVDAQPGSPESAGAAAPMRAFGRRHAWVAQAMLRAESRPDLCVMETVGDGWVFLLPVGAGRASLQFVAIPSITPLPAPNHAVAATRTIRKAIDGIGAWSDPMPCMPRARLPPACPGRIAVGEAALAFDPVSGDGVGHALRGAVLAATSLHAIANGAPIAECLDGYASTLRRAMAHHLKTCLALYGAAPRGPGWRDEVSAMAAGVALLTGKAVDGPT